MIVKVGKTQAETTQGKDEHGFSCFHSNVIYYLWKFLLSKT